jgi:hypothetical protein
MACYDSCYACGADRPDDVESVTADEALDDLLARIRRLRGR